MMNRFEYVDEYKVEPQKIDMDYEEILACKGGY